jgi:hypothetical protein
MKNLLIVIIAIISFPNCFCQISNLDYPGGNIPENNITVSIRPSFFIPTGRMNNGFTMGPGISIQVEKPVSKIISICISGEYYMYWKKDITLDNEITIRNNNFSNLFNLTFGPKYYFIKNKFKMYSGLESGMNLFLYSGETIKSISTGDESKGSASYYSYLGINSYFGTEFPLNKKTTLSFQTKYNVYFLHGISREPNNYFSFQAGLSFSL